MCVCARVWDLFARVLLNIEFRRFSAVRIFGLVLQLRMLYTFVLYSGFYRKKKCRLVTPFVEPPALNLFRHFLVLISTNLSHTSFRIGWKFYCRRYDHNTVTLN